MTVWWLRLLAYARPYWAGLATILGLMLIGVGLGLLTPWPLKLIVDHVLTGTELPFRVRWIEGLPGAGSREGLLVWLASSTLALFLASRAVTILERYLKTGVGNRLVYALGADLFESLQRQSQRFHTKWRKGDLIRRVLADTTCARELVLDVVLPLLVALTSLVAMFAVMWRLSRPLALFAVAVAIPLGLVVRVFARPMSERKLAKKRLQGEMMSFAEQALTAVPLVQSFGQEKQEDERFRGVSDRTMRASLRTTRVKLQFKVACGLVTALATAGVMVFGGLQVLQGSLTIGTLLVLLHYFAALYSPLESMAYLSDSAASASAGAGRVFGVLDATDDTIPERPGAPALALSTGAGAELRFDGVTFGYDPARPVLQAVAIRIRAGEAVALVGPSGAGKSTLLSLVPRLFDVDQGALRVGGVDVRDVGLRSLRAQIALVLQEPFLLPLSVADNIAYARPGASRRDIQAAAETACAHDFIERLPHGYDTIVGERGATLSGGEKQRLAIARAVLKDAPILLLDEPTAALDAFTETSLLEALEALMRHRTSIVVAHRRSTVRRADRLLVLEGGRIVEEDGRYALGDGGLLSRLSTTSHDST